MNGMAWFVCHGVLIGRDICSGSVSGLLHQCEQWKGWEGIVYKRISRPREFRHRNIHLLPAFSRKQRARWSPAMICGRSFMVPATSTDSARTLSPTSRPPFPLPNHHNRVLSFILANKIFAFCVIILNN